MCTLNDPENRCALGAGASYAVVTYRASAWVGPNPLSDWIRRNPTTVVLDHWLFFSSIEGCSWHLGLLPPAHAPSSSRSGHLWGMERSGPQTSMEEKKHLEHKRGNTVRSQSPLSLQRLFTAHPWMQEKGKFLFCFIRAWGLMTVAPTPTSHCPRFQFHLVRPFSLSLVQ